MHMFYDAVFAMWHMVSIFASQLSDYVSHNSSHVHFKVAKYTNKRQTAQAVWNTLYIVMPIGGPSKSKPISDDSQ